MSREEYQQQHDKLKTMAEELSAIKGVFKLWPYAVALGSLMSALVGVTVFLVNYDGQLVKKPQFEEHVKVDNANISTVVRYHLIDSTINDAQDVRLDRLESTPKARYTEVTQTKDKYGKRHYNPIN